MLQKLSMLNAIIPKIVPLSLAIFTVLDHLNFNVPASNISYLICVLEHFNFYVTALLDLMTVLFKYSD